MHMTKKIFFLLLLFTLFAPNFAFADDPPPLLEDVPSPIVRPDPIPAEKPKTPPTIRLVNPIGGKYNEDYTKQTDEDSQGKTNIQIIIGNAIQVTLRLLGAITLAVFFYGGFMWLTSAGNAEKVSTGTKTMMYAVIGLFIIFGAYGILNTIISGIKSSSPASGGNSVTNGSGGTSNCDAQCQKELDCSKKNNDCLVAGGDYETCLEELRQCTR